MTEEKVVTIDARGMGCPIPVVKTIKKLDTLDSPCTVVVEVDNTTAVQNLLTMAKGKDLFVEADEVGVKHFVVRIEVGEEYLSKNRQKRNFEKVEAAGQTLRGRLESEQENSKGNSLNQERRVGGSEVVRQESAVSGERNSAEQKDIEKKLPSEDDELMNTDTERGTVVVLSSNTMGEGDEELGGILIKGFLYALTELDNLPRAIVMYNSGVKLAIDGTQVRDLKTLEDHGVEILICGTCLDYYGIKGLELEVGQISNMYYIVETLHGAEKIIRP